jgi:hypothetical protein
LIHDMQQLEASAGRRRGRPRFAAGGPMLAGLVGERAAAVARWALTRARSGAEVRLVVDAGTRRDPLLVTWGYELGRVAVLPLDFQAGAAAWAVWRDFGKLWTQLVRWAAPGGGDEAAAGGAVAREGRAIGANRPLLEQLATATGGRVDPTPAEVVAARDGRARETRPFGSWLIADRDGARAGRRRVATVHGAGLDARARLFQERDLLGSRHATEHGIPVWKPTEALDDARRAPLPTAGDRASRDTARACRRAVPRLLLDLGTLRMCVRHVDESRSSGVSSVSHVADTVQRASASARASTGTEGMRRVPDAGYARNWSRTMMRASVERGSPSQSSSPAFDGRGVHRREATPDLLVETRASG